MKAIFFTSLLFGFLFVFRILQRARTNHVFEAKVLTKIGTLGVMILTVIAFLHLWSPIFHLMIHYLLLFLFSYLEFLYVFLRARRFETEILPFLDRVILKMRLGHGFRAAALQVLAENSDGFFTKKMQEWFKTTTITRHNTESAVSDQLRQVLVEFEAATKDAHLAIERMQALRRKLKMRSEFRRRSGQILTQVRLQALLLLGLYLALGIYVVNNGDWQRHLGLMAMSAALFIVGQILLFKMGKGIRWKV